MNSFLIAMALFGHNVQSIQYDQGTVGRTVTISVDDAEQTTFAGRLSFHDATHSWTSYCGDVRTPIQESQSYAVAVTRSAAVGGNIARAGNIVAKYFNVAQTPEQCAGLQLAIWKEVEDGDDGTDFAHGHFQAWADRKTMGFAVQYLQAAGQGGDAFYLQAQGGQGFGQGRQGSGGQSGNSGNSGGGQSQFSGGSGSGNGRLGG